jgi:hypothetical protein
MLFSCIDGIFSLIRSRFMDYSNHMYIPEFEVKDNNGTARPSPHLLLLHQESGSEE